MVRYVPFRLMSITWSHSSGVILSMGAQVPLMPALANTMSSRPHRSTVCRTAASTSSETETSQTVTRASPPLRRIACSTCRSSLRRGSAATTRTPSRLSNSAAARPIPDPAPVTNATLPFMDFGSLAIK